MGGTPPHGLSRNGGIREYATPTELIIHRFALLGILDESGIPVENMGIVAYQAENVLPLRTRAAGVI